ncbi:tRNA-specific 2-thiouridylase [Megalodesulfovibrio gigas]|uniref:tRNA-uridine 2-sulfurtransferase n=1 Tax=Megalodesulfovibrio gigas (strain ATCC 19364 / DSM 1382 / NCIMB 9332 / VKM B-1759) TaxID=1121448 RepID=T2GFK2_MEGG1|nr:tRNA-specific 2-thiouridylase [Megalodesulfovibrio gigas]AGW14916.1 putative tRNA (5-methylaminomethyl-2-thiouridylate)-methyltransferase [Megalodesulfovibrio gigas DSM 1382 = ATCC 19364]
MPAGRVAVAVSGGMDSLLALALLADAGQAVCAVHGIFFPQTEATRRRSEALAALCHRLGVAFVEADLVTAFRERVIQPFIDDYLHGRTPNPCAGCNARIKFGLLLDHALAAGADVLATGHYARQGMDAGRPCLRKGADPAKDQSYFLSLVPLDRLARARFPLDGWRKADVPAALAARGLTPPESRESQEICFIPDDDYRAFLRANAPRPGDSQGGRLGGPGPILLEGPERIRVGTHQGLWAYTPGQRRGLGVAHSEPLFVLGKDQRGNALLVGPRESSFSPRCVAAACNLLVPCEEWPEVILARTRYRQVEQPARWRMEQGRLILDFQTPQPLPAPGQVAAVYDAQGRVLAGGVIEESPQGGCNA